MGRAYRQCVLFTRLNLIFTPFRISYSIITTCVVIIEYITTYGFMPYVVSDAQRRPPFPFITAHEVGVLNEKRCKFNP